MKGRVGFISSNTSAGLNTPGVEWRFDKVFRARSTYRWGETRMNGCPRLQVSLVIGLVSIKGG